jgi:hypothetical protein
MSAYTASASPPPLRSLRSLLAGPALQLYGLALPSSGAIFFGAAAAEMTTCRCAGRIADMSTNQLLTQPIEIIFVLSLRRAPYPPPSDHVSRRPNLDRILLPRSWFTRQSASPPPLLSAITSDLAPATSQGSISGWGPFFYFRASLTTCRGEKCIADLPLGPLLTIWSKSMFITVAETCSVSSSLGPCIATPNRDHILLP